MEEIFYVAIRYDGTLLDVQSFYAKNENLAKHSAKRYYASLFGSKYANKCKYSIIKD